MNAARETPTHQEYFIPGASDYFIQLHIAILGCTILTQTAKQVWMRLAFFAGKNGVCCPSYATLAKALDISRRATIEGVKLLVEQGFIVKIESDQIKGRARKSNQFRFLWHPIFEDAVPSGGEQKSQTKAKPRLSVVKGVHQGGANAAPKENQGRESRKEPPQNISHQGSPRGGELSEVQEEYIRLKVDAVDRAGKLRESKAAFRRALRSKALEGKLDMSDLDDLRNQAKSHERARQHRAREKAEKQEQERSRREREEECRRKVGQWVRESGKSLEDLARELEEEGRKPFNKRKQFFGMPWVVAKRYLFEIYAKNNAVACCSNCNMIEG